MFHKTWRHLLSRVGLPKTRQARLKAFICLGLMLLLTTGFSTLLLPIFALASSNHLNNLPSDFDPGFGQGEIITTSIGSYADGSDIVIQPNGKIIVAGTGNSGGHETFALARYDSQGNLDGGFGSGGIVTTSIGSKAFGYDLALQPDHKIILAGYSNNGNQNTFALARYEPSGSLDNNFGNGGVVTTTIENTTSGLGVALQFDGKIVVVGSSNNGARDAIALARYNSDGSLDNNFGQAGIITTSISHNKDFGFDVAIQPDHKIVVVGVSIAANASTITIVRYNANGTLDNGFGSSGIVTTPIATYSAGQTIAIQPDSKIIVGGWYAGIDPLSVLVRYDSTGHLDNQFGNGGISTQLAPKLFGCGNSLSDIALEPNGRIVIVATASDCSVPPKRDLIIARFWSQGNLDIFFGNAGFIRIGFPFQFPVKSYLGKAIALQPDGKIVFAGSYQVVSQIATSYFALARFLGGDDPNIKDMYLPVILKR